ncbi:recombinase family protein [Paenarthrobacter ureafaciens]|uniref:recombinase family protein n=1 Tax=Paenarthrobacter ureafaciens TaxID=37931 RepID=UPI002DB6BD68|nr:recombinase family protein [Paenarthrobacter ureafaciens]MEC3853456.1 recombinase family protein [Paenarthrobacter ureafaciens]
MQTPGALAVIGYIRVSTSKQDVSPEVQQAALESEAARHGWALTIYRENAASAKSLKNRPVLAEALHQLKAGNFDALAVSKLDRLSRSVADFAAMLETASRQRWALICLDLGIDTSTITGAAMAQVTCTFAEMERKKIAERTSAAMQQKAAAGQHMGRRSVLSRDTVQLILDARGRGLALARIAAMLNDSGVPTATGKSWHASTVRQVLGSAAARAAALQA